MLKQITLVAITSAFLVACVSSGNTKLATTNNEDIKSAFQKGRTTQNEVKLALGEPNDTDIMSDGQIKWIYTHVKRSMMMRNFIPVVNWFSAGTDDTTKKLVLIFKNGILQDLSSSTATGETKSGILG
ncbi:MAG: hypothetical protein EOP33_01520 [Rickettsiaceae bacterium]|nr:MAG: hypothetical protein EOP33_01520 [Rickettsiaceae bacterium]